MSKDKSRKHDRKGRVDAAVREVMGGGDAR